ncbi:hypothetical protein Psta_3389 [Pirellula staleyi DSM 6068]|uniref:Pyrrolo-quinoline quinone repeat domain-containing protein n=1 Tax=Pirellula staleyi (strain ATCC 27377 / DSM 6068 / ICPB 4128) TaxID=530564 RepID=D2QXX6_PIRSD|nr:PQQ-binding-like beta-propeller repeat protein [Pirellula staleyi]ADB18053.1 hypothetical protein Psta_3389 [Pirellula staleyi DSM 6068]
MSIRRKLATLLMVMGTSATLVAAEPAGSWPQWRGPDRTGISSETGLLKDWSAKAPTLVWSVEGMGDGYASVSIADGMIYTTGNFADGQGVTCTSAETGKVVWTSKITSEPPKHSYEGSRCTPTIDGPHLYCVASSGAIVCLKRDGGEVVWKRDFKSEFGGKMMSGWGYSESPLVDGDWVLCTPGGKEAMVVALHKLTGDTVWQAAVPAIEGKGKDGAGYSSIIISNAAGVKQYVQLTGRGLVGIEAATGKFLWSYNDVANDVANIPTPIASGDYIFSSTGYQTGSALLKLVKEGTEIKAEEQYFLNADVLQNHHGGMILKDGHIYCGHRHNNGFPICVEMSTGKVVWGGETRGVGKGSAAVTLADGNLIFRYESGEVALIECTTEGYKLKGSFTPEYVSKKPCWAHPVVAGKRLYLREQDKLMCYDIKE